jgi:hypothetical protein
MKKFCIGCIALGFFVLSFNACTRTSADQLTHTSCDTANLKYADILPIIKTYCYGCHAGDNTVFSGGINLEGYAYVQPWAGIGGYLEGNITHAPGFNPMPADRPGLPDCEVGKIVAWVHRGAPEN